MSRLSAFVARELELARSASSPAGTFGHLERAHILSQYSTADHIRVHWAMLRWAFVQRDVREAVGQVLRIAGAATKTAIGWVPIGNTGGANVSPFKPMPLPDDLAKLISSARL